MVEKVSVPVLADCDSGFGGIGNVVHTVRSYEAAGVRGVCIEDKTFPRLNSFIVGNQALVPIEDFAGRIVATVRHVSPRTSSSYNPHRGVHLPLRPGRGPAQGRGL